MILGIVAKNVAQVSEKSRDLLYLRRALKNICHLKNRIYLWI
jgi:hypothetical protein